LNEFSSLDFFIILILFILIALIENYFHSDNLSADQTSFLAQNSLSKATSRVNQHSSYHFLNTLYYDISISSGSGGSIYINSTTAVVSMNDCYVIRSVTLSGYGGGYYFNVKSLTMTYSGGYECMAFYGRNFEGQFFYFITDVQTNGLILSLKATLILRRSPINSHQ
jgi:hypothetical protein